MAFRWTSGSSTRKDCWSRRSTITASGGQIACRRPKTLFAAGRTWPARQPARRSLPPRAPGAGEVEIEIFAAGLNFKEVLYATGLLPEAESLGGRFGLECAGRISRVGEGVRARHPGEAVLVYAAGCMQLLRRSTANAGDAASGRAELH